MRSKPQRFRHPSGSGSAWRVGKRSLTPKGRSQVKRAWFERKMRRGGYR